MSSIRVTSFIARARLCFSTTTTTRDGRDATATGRAAASPRLPHSTAPSSVLPLRRCRLEWIYNCLCSSAPSMVDASLASRDHRRGPPNCGKLPNAGQHEPELTCWVVAGQLLRWSRVVTSTRQGRSGEEQGDGSSVGERKQWREMI